MSRMVWTADRGCHETDETYRLVLLDSGAIRWVKVDDDDDDESKRT